MTNIGDWKSLAIILPKSVREQKSSKGLLPNLPNLVNVVIVIIMKRLDIGHINFIHI